MELKIAAEVTNLCGAGPFRAPFFGFAVGAPDKIHADCQCLKWRRPVKTIAIPCLSQKSMES
jgi:hypothetical protein